MKAPEEPSKNTSDGLLDTKEKKKSYLRDMTKPIGDACRDDGTLKDASELFWPNSPTDPEPDAPQISYFEQHNDETGFQEFQDESDQNDLSSISSIRVSCVLQI